MVQNVLKDYGPYLFAIPIGIVVGAGVGVINAWRLRRQFAQTTESGDFGSKHGLVLVGLILISLGLFLASVFLIVSSSSKGTVLNAETLGFLIACLVSIFVFITYFSLVIHRSRMRLEKRDRDASPSNSQRSHQLPKEAREE